MYLSGVHLSFLSVVLKLLSAVILHVTVIPHHKLQNCYLASAVGELLYKYPF